MTGKKILSPAVKKRVGCKRKKQNKLTFLPDAPPYKRSQINLAPTPPSPTASTSSVPQKYHMEVKVESESVSIMADEPPSLSSVGSVPTPPTAAECGVKVSAQSMPPSLPMLHPSSSAHQSLGDEHSDYAFHFGSEADSDGTDDEELVSPFIPRVYRSALETPLDAEIDAVTFGRPTPSDLPPGGDHSISTEQPWSLYDFQWRTFPNPPIPPESRRETFSESNVGPTIPSVDPYDIFVAIWDRQFMEHIASETNRYAQQLATLMLNNHSLQPNSRIGKWRDTTADELYVYFSIIIAMGVVVKAHMDEYWNASSDVFYTPGFTAHMSGKRFHLISTCLHFNNNKNMCALELDINEAKLFKIQPVLSHLNMKFQSLYNLRQNIALDASLLQWKGLLYITQLIPNDAAVVGMKTYEVCESQTGYLWRFEVHAHKKSQQQSEDILYTSTLSIVLRLTSGLENKGHTLWMDNYYNSPSLARRLKSLGFDCVGTLRTDRKFVPQGLHNLTNANMQPGQISGLTSGDVDVMVWRDDNNRVAMISTYHGNEVSQVRGSTKPILILDYNIMMGGVDKKDQMMAMYPIERKRTKVWYKKFFRRLLNVSVLNSYIIHYQNSSSSLTHRNFRIALVKSILSKHAAPAPLLTVVNKQNHRIDVTHRLAEYPMVGNQRRRRMCVVCKKRVYTYCLACSKSVCIDKCFLAIHC